MFSYLLDTFLLLLIFWYIEGKNEVLTSHSKEVYENGTSPNKHRQFGKSYDDWSKGIDFERNFWDQWMQTKGGIWAKDFEDRTKKSRPIQDKFINALSSESKALKNIRILDAGAGPLSIVGNYHPNYEIELIAVDPLSKVYDELLAKHGIVPYPRTQYSMVERVHDIFPEKYFDVVHIQNALDHCAHPMVGILSMLKTLKVQGKLLLFHGINEAQNENWVGFHQWNFDVQEGSFIIKNKAGLIINVNSELKGECNVSCDVLVKEHQFNCSILKL